MIFFDLLMTVFEDFVISYFLISFFFEEKRFRLSSILTFICVIETFILNNYFKNNELLFFSLVLTCMAMLCIIKRKVNWFYLVIPCLLIGLLLVSNITSFYIVSLLTNIKINDISNNLYMLVLTILLSRLIFLITSIYLYNSLKSLRIKRDQYAFIEYKSFIIFILCLFSIVTTIGESIVYGIFDYKIYLLLIIEFLLMCISSIVLFINIQNNYKNQLKMQSEVIQLKYSRQMYFETCKLSYQLSQDKHDLYYLLKKIEDAIIKKNNNEGLYLIQNAIGQINKVDISYTSSNPLFDYMITKKIKNLKLFKYDVIYTANISQKELLNDLTLIDNLERYIDCLTLNNTKSIGKYLEVSIYEKNNYIIFDLRINKNMELSNSIFNFENKSEHILQESLNCESSSTGIKVLIK